MLYSVEQPPNCDPLRLSPRPEDLGFSPKEEKRPPREGGRKEGEGDSTLSELLSSSPFFLRSLLILRRKEALVQHHYDGVLQYALQ